jgi:hypothetical protein
MNESNKGNEMNNPKIQINKKLRIITITPDDGKSFKVDLEWGVCPVCKGEGSHTNPSIDSNGLSSDELHEDPEFAENYFSGVYDVKCSECQGERVIPTSSDLRFIEFIQKDDDERYEMDMEVAAEIRMGC